MRMGQGVRTGLGHGGITCVLQTQFSSFTVKFTIFLQRKIFSGLLGSLSVFRVVWKTEVSLHRTTYVTIV